MPLNEARALSFVEAVEQLEDLVEAEELLTSGKSTRAARDEEAEAAELLMPDA